MKVFPDFENEVKAIDPRLTIVKNPNRPGLANIKLDNRDVCPIPDGEIFDEPDAGYVYEFPNGFRARHKSRNEALGQIRNTLGIIESKEGADQFYGRGDYDTNAKN